MTTKSKLDIRKFQASIRLLNWSQSDVFHGVWEYNKNTALHMHINSGESFAQIYLYKRTYEFRNLDKAFIRILALMKKADKLKVEHGVINWETKFK